MYMKVCTSTKKNPHQSEHGKSLSWGPDSKWRIQQHVDSLKIANVTPHLKDNLMQIHILIKNILQMDNFLSYDLKMLFLKFQGGRQ